MTQMLPSIGHSRIEITNIDTGEKVAYDAILTEHRVDMNGNRPSFIGHYSTVTDYSARRNKEITLKFVELQPTKTPVIAGTDKKESQEEDML
jgi:hypothetical protein